MDRIALVVSISYGYRGRTNDMKVRVDSDTVEFLGKLRAQAELIIKTVDQLQEQIKKINSQEHEPKLLDSVKP